MPAASPLKVQSARRTLAGAVFSFFVAAIIMPAPAAYSQTDRSSRSIDSFESELLELVERCEPIVVVVEAHLALPLQRRFPARKQVSRRTGSGICLSDDGTVVTTADVVDGANRVLVKNRFGEEFEAEIVGIDRRTNIALLGVPGGRLAPARIGESSLSPPGSRVVVIGSLPYRQPLSSFGAIEVDRGLVWGYSEVELLLINAPVIRGNSGSAVVNSEGRVVAMVSGVLADKAGSTRLGSSGGLAGYVYREKVISARGNDVTFAIPIEKVKDIAAELKDHGRVDRGFFGVIVQRQDAGGMLGKGVLISDLLKGAPAHTAGLQIGDVILQYAGRDVTIGDDLTFLVTATRPGSEVEVLYRRRGRDAIAHVVIGLAPNLYASTPQMPTDRSYPSDMIPQDSRPVGDGKNLGQRPKKP